MTKKKRDEDAAKQIRKLGRLIGLNPGAGAADRKKKAAERKKKKEE